MENNNLNHSSRIIFFLTEKMYLNKREVDDVPLHKRGGKGINAIMLHHEDSIKTIVSCSNSEKILFFSDGGCVFVKRASEINDLGRKGINIRELIQLPEEDIIVALLPIKDEDLDSPNISLFFATKKGMVKKTNVSKFRKINVNGKVAIKLKEGDVIRSVSIVNENSNVILSSSAGRLVRFFSNFSSLGRMAKGRCGLIVRNNEEVVSSSTTLEGSKVLSICEKGIGKISKLDEFRESFVGKKVGVKAQKINDKTGKLLACTLVNESDEIILVTRSNKINRFRVSELNVQGRNTLGVILMRPEEKDRIVAFTKN